MDEVRRAIAAEYGLPGFDPVVKSLADLDARALDRYQGRYEIDFDGQTVPVLVSLTGDHLRLNFKGGDWELYPESETKFFTMDAALVVTFIVDGEGRATGFVVNETMTAKKV